MADVIGGSNPGFDGLQYIELAGTSSEDKPVGKYLTGSMFIEVDTGKVFLYNRTATSGNEWVEQFSLKG